MGQERGQVMKATDYIAQALHEKNVTAVFEMSGGMITHLLDSIHLFGKTRIVSTHHEQAAAFAAEGYGRMTGVPGVAMATSGPGATNLLTGVGSCYFDSTPAVFITGQVNRHEQKGNKAIRQLGFQETDIVSMAAPITKHATMVQNPESLQESLEHAFETATSGRPGPVLLDIPMDVQRLQIEPKPVGPSKLTKVLSDEMGPFLEETLKALHQAKFPLILIGGGIRSGRCTDMLLRLIEKLGVPVVNSLMAVDVLPFLHPLRVGMIGTYGNRWANIALHKSDCILVLGSRLDVRQTGSDTKAFSNGKSFFHVDCESGEMNNRVEGCRTLVSELRTFLEFAIAHVSRQVKKDDWQFEISESRRQWPDDGELPGIDGINPNQFMHALSAATPSASAYVVDVGQHQMWAAQSLRLGADQRFLTSGGMGSMGFALPAAIGVSVAVPHRPCVMIAGDGGFQTNIQELETVRRYGLPIKMIVINNQCHGMVRQFQESYFGGRYQSTFWGYSAPDFEKVSQAYGIRAKTIRDTKELEFAMDWLSSDNAVPCLLQVMVDTYANAYPKVAFGCPISEMEPFAKPIEMEST